LGTLEKGFRARTAGGAAEELPEVDEEGGGNKGTTGTKRQVWA